MQVQALSTSCAAPSSSAWRALPCRRAPRTAALVVRANVEQRQNIPAPKGVTQPPYQPQVPPAKFGFVDNAERINSRAAMIGFFALLAVEAIFNKGLLELIGLTVGKGLGFEF